MHFSTLAHLMKEKETSLHQAKKERIKKTNEKHEKGKRKMKTEKKIKKSFLLGRILFKNIFFLFVPFPFILFFTAKEDNLRNVMNVRTFMDE